VSALPVGARVFLTIGRKEIAAFIERDDLTGIIRMIEPPSIALNANWKLHLAKPPFSIEAERTLMSHETITHLVTKNAGGEATRAKLAAARALSIPVIMIARPGKPDAPCVSKISDAETWLARLPPKASQRRTLA
jgi:precorrin-6A/cobalt-precorrin-6A reductase